MKACLVIVFAMLLFLPLSGMRLKAFKIFVLDSITKARAEVIKKHNIFLFQHLPGIRNLLRLLKEFSAKT